MSVRSFDHRPLARELKLPDDQLEELEGIIRALYFGDEMLIELRMVRTVNAIAGGAVTLPQAIAEFRSELQEGGDALPHDPARKVG